MSGAADTSLPSEVADVVVGAIRAGRDELVELTRELIEFDTTARLDADEPAHDERAFQEHLADRVAASGATIEVFEPDPIELQDERQIPDGIRFDGRPQLVATLPGAGLGPSMLLNGHIDVVPCGARRSWSTDPLSAQVRDGDLYGRGACDMKGGIASMIFAVEALAAAGVRLAGDVIINTVTDEESSGAGAIACARAGVRADACIVPEPTGLGVWLACRGSCLARIEIDGHPGHVEIPQEHWSRGGGVNAIEKSLSILQALERLSREWALRPDQRHALLAPGQISPVRISAGDWPVTIPSRCEVDCDVTFLPGNADADGWDSRVRAEVEEWIAATAAGDPWLAQRPPRVTWAMVTPPLEVSQDEPIVGAVLAGLAHLGYPEVLSGLDSWYDGATFARIHGMPAVGFGPGSIRSAHAIDEHVPVDALVDCAAVIALALIEHCGLAT